MADEKLQIRKLLLASGNPGKLRELRGLLEPRGVSVIGLDDLDPRPEEVEETGDTFLANAALKAVGYGRALAMAALADDSGLRVDALGGGPGVHSARFSGPGANAAKNNALLIDRLADTPDAERGAHFACTMALYVPPGPLRDALIRRVEGLEGVEASAEEESGEPVFWSSGKTFGTMLRSQRGQEGFGYDPLFLSNDLGVTFAEASIEDKAGVSHRGRALRAMAPLLGQAKG